MGSKSPYILKTTCGGCKCGANLYVSKAKQAREVFLVHVNKFSALLCHGEDMIPTTVQEAQDMAYPDDIVDFVVEQTNVDFPLLLQL